MNTETEAAIDAGQRLAGAQILENGTPFVVASEGSTLLNLESLLLNPLSIGAQPTFNDLDSFIRYVNQFGPSASPVVFATLTEQSVSFTAVLDYHEPSAPHRARHRALYACAASPEWRRWSEKSSTEANPKPFTQAAFAAFIEDNLHDIIEPSGADVLEIARTLEAKQSVNFKSGIRLSNGDHSLSYVSETKGAAGGNGELAIPENFMLGIPPFVGSSPYKVTARLRYSITEGCLKFRYELVRPHKIIEAACKEMVERVTKETSLTPLMGTPGAPGL